MKRRNKSIETLDLRANGLRFAARAQGAGPLVLCLHGFPDSAHSFDALLPELAGAGYRAVAPFLRGYAPTAAPADHDYSLPTLARDALALADALGQRQCHIIGHDWGALIAYAAAAYAPDRIRRMATMAVPPLHRFLANMQGAQLRRSWYMGFFCVPWLAERRLAQNDCALVDRLWRAWSPGWEYTQDDIAPIKAILSDARSRRAALGYYRALPAALLSPRRNRERRLLLGKLRVPTLMLAGGSDGCIGPEMWAGAGERFACEARVHTLAAGHFMHREEPERVAALLLEFLGPPPGR